MDLSHQSITGHQFDLNRRGYDPDAVDEHLREVAAAVAERDAEVADKDRSIAELRQQIAELEAKVQDADESEEALRLTLKAAAHAKEELLAGARDQAAVLEREAAEKAERVLAEAEASAQKVTDEANARATAMTEGSRERAREVAQAALSESELLVVRIEQLRSQVEAAEGALRDLQSEASPRLVEARQGLDRALEAARASAQNPELLAAAASHVAQQDEVDEPAPADQPSFPEQGLPGEDARFQQEAADQTPSSEDQTVEDNPDEQSAMPGNQPMGEAESATAAATADVGDSSQGEQGEQAHAETSADISDKVDRLLEELREVT